MSLHVIIESKLLDEVQAYLDKSPGSEATKLLAAASAALKDLLIDCAEVQLTLDVAMACQAFKPQVVTNCVAVVHIYCGKDGTFEMMSSTKDSELITTILQSSLDALDNGIAQPRNLQ